MKCPYCGKESYSTENPLLEDTILLGETVFFPRCPFCKQRMKVEIIIKTSKISKEKPKLTLEPEEPE